MAPRALADELARRRAAALAGHTGDAAAARAALVDPAGPVRAAALGALARCGDLKTEDVAAGLADAAPEVRQRAAELASWLDATSAAGAADLRLAPLLVDPDDTVVEVVAFACGERVPPEPGIVEPLARVATEHQDALCREAAVAALGAIGDPDGLPAVLAALRDKPAIRRRAVLALAPFEGPEVSAALTAALEDRDWQVRQAAEELLGIEGSGAGP